MNNALASTILFALQALLKFAPELFFKIQAAISKKDVTVDDLVNLRTEIERDSYSSIVTNSKLSDDQKTK